jgi:hypothetical protein
MNNLDNLFTQIANDHLGISSLQTRNSDSHDFHDVSVWGIHAALKAAYMAGARSYLRIEDEIREALEHVTATLKVRHLDEASDDEVGEALSIARLALASSKRHIVEPTEIIETSVPAETIVPSTRHSPSPWSYEYNPYTLGRGEEAGVELAAFEVFDAEGNKVFDTNEDLPSDVQEANARLAASAPDLLAVLDRCANLLADYDEHDGEEGETYRDAIAVINEATAGKHNA